MNTALGASVGGDVKSLGKLKDNIDLAFRGTGPNEAHDVVTTDGATRRKLKLHAPRLRHVRNV
jgi:hypothetical protein